VDIVECWDEALDSTYVSISADSTLLAEDGECQEPLSGTLAALGIPTLNDIDQELMDDLGCVAENGLEGCED
jgi:hypothetical protein